MPLDLDDELNRLYGVELAEFVPERNRLATSLRKEGRRVEAERVKELRKPSPSVWTVNQLARTQRKEIDLLLDAGHRLVESQRALLSGSGGQEAFDAARKTERVALKRLVEAARAILAERASPSTLERVASTLRAAAVSEEARPDLARGRLTSDVEPAGFEAFAGLLPAGAAPAKPRARPQRAPGASAEQKEAERQAAKRDAIKRATAELRTAEERETTAAKQLREAERAEREAREQLEQVEQTVEHLRAERESAARALEKARSKLAEERRS